MNRSSRQVGRRSLTLAALLSACSGSRPDVDLPAGAAAVPGRAVVAAWSAVPSAVLPDALPAGLGELLGLELHAELPGWRYATSGLAPAGWATLADSPPFRSAWLARPEVERAYWVYFDLQAGVDRALSEITSRERRLRRMLEPLGLTSFEWAIFAIDERRPIVIDGRIHATEGPIGLAATFGGSSAPSLLGEAVQGEQLRAEIRFDSTVARRTLDASLGPGDAMSSRDAMLGVFAPIVRAVLDQLDGTASAVIDADGRLVVAIGLRKPDDARDALDRFLRRDAADAWNVGGRVATVVGHRLLVADEGATAGDPGGPPIADAVTLRLALPDRPRGVLRLVRLDAETLSLSARID